MTFMLASGPRFRYRELTIPALERAGIVHHATANKSAQAEAITMVYSGHGQPHCCIAGAQGHYELNVFKPVMAYNVFTECQSLSEDACEVQ